jgi:Uncharacterized protein conserved in bacteria (DUF2330)
MKRRIAYASALVTLLTSAAAFPCGMSFGNNVTIDPHQDIVVAWKDGVETYAFQPTFCGTATDFGLILPVPAQLSQSPATTDPNAFTTAATLSEPNKHQVTEQSSIGCATAGSESRNGGLAADDSPAVVASGRVGFLDWVQLKASTESSFTDWLTANGYAYSDAASSVFSYYVTKGWYFLAFRISQDAVSGNGTVCRSLGPVVLSFPAAGPVVPSRMAAADSTSAYSRVTWRIFGITHGDVQLTFPAANSYDQVLWYSGAIKDADVASLGGLAQSGDRLTRLTYSFYKGSATADVDLTLTPAQDYRGTEDVVVYDDSACSIRPHHRLPHSGLLSLAGLTIVALFVWRRYRS